MATRKYTGRWRAQYDSVPKLDEALPLGRPENARYHMGGYDAPGSRPPYAAPRELMAPPGMTDGGQSYDNMAPSSHMGGPLDLTPLDHGLGMPAGGSQRSVDAAQRSGNAARSRDYGAVYARLTRPLEFDPGTRSTNMLVVTPDITGSKIAALRGKNSLPENNPDGFRDGQRVQRWYAWKIPMHYRRHELRAYRDKLAAPAQDSPALVDGNRYTSPYGTLVSGRKRTVQSPVIRRTPRSWAEDIQTDGVTDGSADVGMGALTGWGL